MSDGLSLPLYPPFSTREPAPLPRSELLNGGRRVTYPEPLGTGGSLLAFRTRQTLRGGRENRRRHW